MTTNLFDLIHRHQLDEAFAEKFVNIREDGAGLRILNYSDAAVYTPGAWANPAVRQCRGIIVDERWDVVARPWSKFFNHGQAEAGELDLSAPVEVTDKMDGSLGIVHLGVDGEPRVASRGSFESDQAIHATAVLRHRYAGLVGLREVTPLVEIVYPANRIVVDYGDLDDLVLLGGVVIATGEYLGPTAAAAAVAWSGPLTETFAYPTMLDALAAPTRPGMEGLCVRRLDRSEIVKIKQEEYVRLHKIVTGLSERSVWEHLSDEKPLEELLGPLPDELHPWARGVWDDLQARTNAVLLRAETTHREVVASLPEDFGRKEYALAAMLHPDMRPYLFQLLDGRDPRASIIKTLKPAGDTRARTITEAVA